MLKVLEIIWYTNYSYSIYKEDKGYAEEKEESKQHKAEQMS